MNFMATRQSGGGFYEEDSSRGTCPFAQTSSTACSSPSSSSSHQQFQQWRGCLVPSSYPNHLQQQPRGPWDETSASFQGYISGSGASHLDLMMMDSRNNRNNNSVEDGDESDEHQAVGGGSASCAGGVMMEREHMFDKVVTPSDVGKLNRLVIPKQHAEKYFPLDSSTNEKGLLLNFEDRNGKPWRFRYSYWNSSQSYVMTKGWSRFVKDKKLDAGDIVSFQRGVGELGKDRLFIDWRRRPGASHHHHQQLPPSMSSTLSIPHQFSFHHPWNHPSYLHHQHQHQQRNPRDHSHLLQLNATSSISIMNNTTNPSHPHHLNNSYSNGNTVMTGNPCSGPIFYLRSASARPQYLGFGHGTVQLPHKGGSVGLHSSGTEEVVVEEEEEVEVEEPMVFESVPVVQGKAAAKRLRLFGVNMDCPISVDDDNCDIVVLPSTAVPHSAMPSQIQSPHSSSSSSISPLQLRPYNYASRPLLQTMPFRFLNNSSSSSSSNRNSSKGKASMSLDLDI